MPDPIERKRASTDVYTKPNAEEEIRTLIRAGRIRGVTQHLPEVFSGSSPTTLYMERLNKNEYWTAKEFFSNAQTTVADKMAVLKQLATFFDGLYVGGISYRDLKPEHVFIPRKRVEGELGAVKVVDYNDVVTQDVYAAQNRMIRGNSLYAPMHTGGEYNDTLYRTYYDLGHEVEFVLFALDMLLDLSDKEVESLKKNKEHWGIENILERRFKAGVYTSDKGQVRVKMEKLFGFHEAKDLWKNCADFMRQLEREILPYLKIQGKEPGMLQRVIQFFGRE